VTQNESFSGDMIGYEMTNQQRCLAPVEPGVLQGAGGKKKSVEGPKSGETQKLEGGGWKA